MRRVISAALCAAGLMAAAGPASAATNGQLVTVSAYNALVTLNPDGSGVHRIFEAPAASAVTSPVWSPDGNRIAFALNGRIQALTLASGAVTELAAGTDPGWTPDGDVAFRRGQDLLAVPAAGGAERSLGRLPDTATQDLAWSPDGWIVRRTGAGDLYFDALDGSLEDPIGSDATGAPDWSPDGELVVFPARDLGPVHLAVNSLDGDTLRLGASGSYPAWSPDGGRIAYWGASGLRLVDGDTLGDAGVPTPPGSFGYLDWQPCVAGVTSSCVSVTPPPPPVTCSASPLSVRSGHSGSARITCNGGTAHTYEVVGAPAHGTTSLFNLPQVVSYRPADGYIGPDSFTVKVTGSGFVATVTVTVTVTPSLQALAAPHLNVIGQPKLDRRGRVTMRALCNTACSVRLRVIIRLNTQRVLKGRIVRASAAAGQTLKLRLRRAKLPKHRRIVAARIAGTLTGTSVPLSRTFTLSLIP